MAEQTILHDPEPGKTILGPERRIWVRFANTEDMGQPIPTSVRDEVDTAWFGTIRNVSPTGIALNISRRFELGTALVVELSAQAKRVLRLPVRVVHATPDEQRRWVIGCAFVSPLSEEDLLTCLQE